MPDDEEQDMQVSEGTGEEMVADSADGMMSPPVSNRRARRRSAATRETTDESRVRGRPVDTGGRVEWFTGRELR